MCYWTLATVFARRAKNAPTRAISARWDNQVVAYYFYKLARTARQAPKSSKRPYSRLRCTAPKHAAAAVITPPQRYNTMQAATLVALLIPVVAIWITVVVRYGRSIEEIVVAAVEKEE